MIGDARDAGLFWQTDPEGVVAAEGDGEPVGGRPDSYGHTARSTGLSDEGAAGLR